ncbi:hypothetical protein PRUPE_3G055800 [Prunus persica]|uniref:non-specific serine/threonine protein kinase n=1 Tax=Prunus persica TaxID=3760 RepID=A0A251PVT8_PRUPE|nr:probable LRR receptor-like serine/threonine-protein kinase At1g05700 isoform X1 [Prunus persica]XP_020415727.1 probable LRR receptor-like serine/threonine-protein kinase At1g05700 isoform X1 [Prunus persica]ONI15689.1 hypothetical protein PRUPE_3G055800 [Prunus persica]
MLWSFTQLHFALLGGFALNLMLLVHSQDLQSGFISIDCGLQTDSSYAENVTSINYISDATFIDTGESKSISPDYRDNYTQPSWSVRSFPEGARNCYKINVTPGNKYFMRAGFAYGNYDGQNKIPEFDLHLGPNLWDTVRFEYASHVSTYKELIHIALRNYIHVCLVNTGSGVPFISYLELRPLPNASYQTTTGSLALVTRRDMGQRPYRRGYRYPFDIHDRFWSYYNELDEWTQVSTSSTIETESDNPFQPPSVVMSTASTPKDPSDSLSIIYVLPDINAEYYSYLHFAEVERVNQSRFQYIFRNGRRTFGPFAPPRYLSYTVYSTGAWSSYAQYANISITRAENSTLPPILNAFEIYMVKKFIEEETSQEDVDAMANIKSTYKIKRNWQGDPCAPQHFVWEGVKCNYQDFESPRIISLNLSSSGLTGEIAASISNLTMIQSLDLSNNNLTGPILDFLSKLPNLTVLNLEKNKFTGSVPVGLIERKNSGFLSLSLCDNAHLSQYVSCTLKKKHSFVIPIVVSIAGILILLSVVAAICWWGFKRKRQHGDVIDAKAIPQYGSLESTKRQFTYSEIIKMTNNFERVLGRGGFGTVYHGYIDHTQVAIKMLSASSVQGFQQFHAEVTLLMRVHHKNLTSLVGYCNDETKVGLVYEYMANGNLLNHLSDSRSSMLTWEDRLRIATDAAQGLEYLHCGCKPPIMHRDVKSTNILLNESFQAKISDFGLSRNFPTHDGTHASSLLAGTPGYLDPEFYLSNRLNEKSDVYSFGVVLLEIITSRPVLTRTHERIHISQWVGFMLANGDINNIVDPRLEGNFNTNSVWKAVEIAMACVSVNAIKRPSISQVVVDLKECLATECARTNHSRVAELDNSNALMADNSIVRLTPSVR